MSNQSQAKPLSTGHRDGQRGTHRQTQRSETAHLSAAVSTAFPGCHSCQVALAEAHRTRCGLVGPAPARMSHNQYYCQVMVLHSFTKTF